MLEIIERTKLVAFVLAFLMVVCPFSSSLAQTTPSDYVQGKMDGERDARGNPVWFLAGLGCGIFGLIGAFVIAPSPPTHALVGKSSDYVLGYTEGYKSKARSGNAMYAAVGAITWVVIYLAVISSDDSSD